MEDLVFRQCMGRFATGVTVVATTMEDGGKCGITVNSFASVSLHPPLVLFSLDKQATNYPLFVKAAHVGISLLGQGQQDISEHFAGMGQKQWQDIAHHAGSKTGAPLIEGADAQIECTLEQRYDAGDHTVFIARVVHMNHKKDANPLLYYQGKYYTLGQKHPNEERA